MDIDNTNMTVYEYVEHRNYLGPEFSVPYSFDNSTSELTIELLGESYTLPYKVNHSSDMNLSL